MRPITTLQYSSLLELNASVLRMAEDSFPVVDGRFKHKATKLWLTVRKRTEIKRDPLPHI
jgi:hypothetical protein